MPTDQETAAQYQDLFNLMAKEHNLILTIAEMDEIILEAQKVVNKTNTTCKFCDDPYRVEQHSLCERCRKILGD